jgi:anti-sigma factor RsiW
MTDSCVSDTWMKRLSDYLDGDLSADERKALEKHLESCSSCAATLEELRRVVHEAGRLEDRPPTGDLWPGIEGRLPAQPRAVPAVESRRRTPSRWVFTLSLPELAAAAAVLILGTAAATYWLARPEPGTPSAELLTAEPAAISDPVPGQVIPPGTEAAALATPTASSGRLKEAALPGEAARLKLDAAIADLLRLLEQNSDRFNPPTLRLLEQKLDAVDRAIAEARQALEQDPKNPYLHRHLYQTLQMKMALLRQATGAARAVS